MIFLHRCNQLDNPILWRQNATETFKLSVWNAEELGLTKWAPFKLIERQINPRGNVQVRPQIVVGVLDCLAIWVSGSQPDDSFQQRFVSGRGDRLSDFDRNITKMGALTSYHIDRQVRKAMEKTVTDVGW